MPPAARWRAREQRGVLRRGACQQGGVRGHALAAAEQHMLVDGCQDQAAQVDRFVRHREVA